MGAMLCRISKSLCFGDARDEEFRKQWERENGTFQRPNERIPLIPNNPLKAGNRSRKKGPNKRKSLRRKR